MKTGSGFWKWMALLVAIGIFIFVGLRAWLDGLYPLQAVWGYWPILALATAFCVSFFNFDTRQLNSKSSTQIPAKNLARNTALSYIILLLLVFFFIPVLVWILFKVT